MSNLCPSGGDWGKIPSKGWSMLAFPKELIPPPHTHHLGIMFGRIGKGCVVHFLIDRH